MALREDDGPLNPHWYVVERDQGGKEFTAFVDLIGTGEVRFYQGHPYRHVSVDGWDYWLTWVEDARNNINRKPSDKAGWATDRLGQASRRR